MAATVSKKTGPSSREEILTYLQREREGPMYTALMDEKTCLTMKDLLKKRKREERAREKEKLRQQQQAQQKQKDNKASSSIFFAEADTNALAQLAANVQFSIDEAEVVDVKQKEKENEHKTTNTAASTSTSPSDADPIKTTVNTQPVPLPVPVPAIEKPLASNPEAHIPTPGPKNDAPALNNASNVIHVNLPNNRDNEYISYHHRTSATDGAKDFVVDLNNGITSVIDDLKLRHRNDLEYMIQGERSVAEVDYVKYKHMYQSRKLFESLQQYKNDLELSISDRNALVWLIQAADLPSGKIDAFFPNPVVENQPREILPIGLSTINDTKMVQLEVLGQTSAVDPPKKTDTVITSGTEKTDELKKESKEVKEQKEKENETEKETKPAAGKPIARTVSVENTSRSDPSSDSDSERPQNNFKFKSKSKSGTSSKGSHRSSRQRLRDHKRRSSKSYSHSRSDRSIDSSRASRNSRNSRSDSRTHSESENESDHHNNYGNYENGEFEQNEQNNDLQDKHNSLAATLFSTSPTSPRGPTAPPYQPAVDTFQPSFPIIDRNRRLPRIVEAPVQHAREQDPEFQRLFRVVQEMGIQQQEYRDSLREVRDLLLLQSAAKQPQQEQKPQQNEQKQPTKPNPDQDHPYIQDMKRMEMIEDPDILRCELELRCAKEALDAMRLRRDVEKSNAQKANAPESKTTAHLKQAMREDFTQSQRKAEAMKIAREVMQAMEDQQAELSEHVDFFEKKYVVGAEVVQLASDLLKPWLGGVGFTGLPSLIQETMQKRQTRRLIEQDFYSKPEAARNLGFAGILNKMALDLLQNIVTGPAAKLRLLAAKQAAAAAARSSSTFNETAAAKTTPLPPRPVKIMRPRPPVEEDDDDDDEKENKEEEKQEERKHRYDQKQPDVHANATATATATTAKDNERMTEDVYGIPPVPGEDDFQQIAKDEITPGPAVSGAALEQLQNLTRITGAAQAANDKMKAMDAKSRAAAQQRQAVQHAQLDAIEKRMSTELNLR